MKHTQKKLLRQRQQAGPLPPTLFRDSTPLASLHSPTWPQLAARQQRAPQQTSPQGLSSLALLRHSVRQ